MSVLEFISALVSACAWPAVALGLGILFRTQIAELLSTVERFKVPGFEALFRESVTELAADGESVVHDLTPDTGKKAPRLDSGISPLASPNNAVADAWTDLEEQVRALAAHHEIASSQRIQDLVVQLRSARLLTREESKFVLDSYSVNLSILGKNDPVPAESSALYVATVGQVSEKIRARLESGVSGSEQAEIVDNDSKR